MKPQSLKWVDLQVLGFYPFLFILNSKKVVEMNTHTLGHEDELSRIKFHIHKRKAFLHVMPDIVFISLTKKRIIKGISFLLHISNGVRIK